MEYKIEDAERSGLAGNGMSLLKGQTTMRDSIATAKGVGVGLITKEGIRIWECVAKSTCIMLIFGPYIWFSWPCPAAFTGDPLTPWCPYS
jgi:hypothetical protein